MPKQTIAACYEKDYDRLDELFKFFRTLKKTDFDRAKQTLLTFRTDLRKHFTWEDEILFPIIESRASIHRGGGPTDMMRMEHDEILEILDRICQRVEQGKLGSETDEKKLLGILEKHTTNERDFLYSLIDWSMSDEERDSILSKMKNLENVVQSEENRRLEHRQKNRKSSEIIT